MKPLIDSLEKIKLLRHEHSRRFYADDFSTMKSVGDKIVKAWNDYEFARRCAFERHVCFTCCSKPDAAFAVESPGCKQPMLFCSDICRLTFSVSLGLT